MTIITIWPLLLFLLVAFRAMRCFNAEVARQRMITWPEAKVSFNAQKITLHDKHAESGRIVPVVNEGYLFYCNGTAYRGNRLVPDPVIMDSTTKENVECLLNEPGSTWKVKYNPQHPADNVLRAGYEKMSWLKVLAYAFIGLVFPLYLLYSARELHSDPATWLELISFVDPQ